MKEITYTPGSHHQVTVTGIDRHGFSFYRDGKTMIFIPRTVPGDEVRIRILKIKNHYGTASVESVVKPSPDRIQPVCEDFVRGCGGCQWLHIRYDAHPAIKLNILNQNLKLFRIPFNAEDFEKSSRPEEFRNKLSLIHENGKLGLMKENSKEIISYTHCYQEMPLNQKIYEKLKTLRLDSLITQIHVRAVSSNEAALYFFAEKFNPKLIRIAENIQKTIPQITGIGTNTYGGYHHLTGKKWLPLTLGGIRYRIPVNGFFQTSYDMAEKLLETVNRFAGTLKNRKLLDLYCGTGFFSLYLAKQGARVTGIEENPHSIRTAIEAAEDNGLKNARFTAGDCQAALKQMKPGEYDLILIDPPRMGCEPPVIRSIIHLQPEKIIYISCSPESLARDLQEILTSGYRIREMKVFDMFPHTWHMETAVLLSKSPKPEVKLSQMTKTRHPPRRQGKKY
jgi:23S rRNA (uracil1939-C5)-methyltransferase